MPVSPKKKKQKNGKRSGVRSTRRQRRDPGNAFFPDPSGGPAHAQDDFADIVAESFVESATSGEEHGEDAANQFVIEEVGGPFLEEPMLDDLVVVDAPRSGPRR